MQLLCLLIAIMQLLCLYAITARKITAGQQSLSIEKAFVTTEKPCQTVTMAATT